MQQLAACILPLTLAHVTAQGTARAHTYTHILGLQTYKHIGTKPAGDKGYLPAPLDCLLLLPNIQRQLYHTQGIAPCHQEEYQSCL